MKRMGTVLANAILFCAAFALGCALVQPVGNDNDGDNSNTNSNTNTNTNTNTNSNSNANTNTNANDNTDDSSEHRAVFNDMGSGFSTTDVRDVDDEVVQFDTELDALIWVQSGTTLDVGFWEVNGNFLDDGHFFQVRFGTVGGDRRAYFTETSTATICDLTVSGSGARVLVYSTQVPVPQN